MKVTVAGLVWLPMSELSHQHIRNIKEKLTIYPKKTTDIGNAPDPQPIFMFEENFDTGMIGIPRGFYRASSTGNHTELLKVSYGAEMPDLKTRFKADGPFAEQEQVIQAFADRMEDRTWGGFLLKAGCGFGKTAVAIEIARRVGRRTLILVHQEFFLDQWRERITDFIPDARVGVIRQNKCEYEGNDFVIGMMQSLAKDDGRKYPAEMYDAFGTLITDECHRIAASTWSSLIPRFNAAWRIGLSATPRRKDGAQDVFFNHISGISYSAETEAQVPKLRTVRVHGRLAPIARGSYRVAVEDLNSGQILSQVAGDTLRSKDIVDQIVLAVKAGRKIMVVSERISHLKDMSDMLTNALFTMDLPFIPKVDYYTGEWYTGGKWENTTKGHRKGDPKMASRTQAELKIAEGANVIFATKQMVSEGLDIQALDVMVLATPFSDIEQAVGRIRRWCMPNESKCQRLCPWRAGKCEKKPTPIVVDVIDDDIPQLIGKWRRRKFFYEETGIIGGRSNEGESETKRGSGCK